MEQFVNKNLNVFILAILYKYVNKMKDRVGYETNTVHVGSRCFYIHKYIM